MIFGYCEFKNCKESAVKEIIVDHIIFSACYKHIEEMNKVG